MTQSQIRTLRKRLGLSPEHFAAALGFASDHVRITVWRWETGRRKPSAQTVALMRRLRHRASIFSLKDEPEGRGH